MKVSIQEADSDTRAQVGYATGIVYAYCAVGGFA